MNKLIREVFRRSAIDESEYVRTTASKTIENIPKEKLIEELIGIIRDKTENIKIRQKALQILALEKDNIEITTVIVHCLWIDNDILRNEAADLIPKLPKGYEVLKEAIYMRSYDTNIKMTKKVLQLLSSAKPTTHEGKKILTEIIIKSLKEGDLELKIGAAQSLGCLDPSKEGFCALLDFGLDLKNPELTNVSLQSMLNFRDSDVPSLEALEEKIIDCLESGMDNIKVSSLEIANEFIFNPKKSVVKNK